MILYFLTEIEIAIILHPWAPPGASEFSWPVGVVAAMSDDDFDTDSDTDDVEPEREVSSAAAERARAQLTLEARRRLEAKLEESRLRRQIGEYDYDLD